MTSNDTILLAVGDPIERVLIAEYLRGCGYRVIEAADATEARIALEHERVDVLVTDVELPHNGSGHVLSAWVHAYRPNIDVVLTSSAERAAEAANELCEKQPTQVQRRHPRELAEEIERLRRRVDAD